jgi:fatty acid-binding protein DegV
LGNIAVVTDSTSSLPEALYRQYAIVKVPYRVHSAGQECWA